MSRGRNSVWWPNSDLSHRRAIPYPTGKRHSGVDTAYNQICFAIAARRHPPTSRALDNWRCNQIAPQHDQQGVPPTGNRWRGGSHGGLRHLRARPAKAREIKTQPPFRNRGVTDLDREVRNVMGMLNAGCTLQQTRAAHTGDRLAPALQTRCSRHPQRRHRRLNADRRRAETLLGRTSGSGPNGGTGKRSRKLLQRHCGDQPLFPTTCEELAKKHSVRAVAVDLNDFRQELGMMKELRAGSCVGLYISPGILRTAEVILHSMRGNELLLMTAAPDVGSRLLALLRASSHVLCDRPSLPLVEQSLRQNRSQLMRLPQVHCASYLAKKPSIYEERNRTQVINKKQSNV